MDNFVSHVTGCAMAKKNLHTNTRKDFEHWTVQTICLSFMWRNTGNIMKDCGEWDVMCSMVWFAADTSISCSWCCATDLDEGKCNMENSACLLCLKCKCFFYHCSKQFHIWMALPHLICLNLWSIQFNFSNGTGQVVDITVGIIPSVLLVV